jgi:hypothetical protein
MVHVQPMLFGFISILSLWFGYKYMEAVNSYSFPLHRIPSSNGFFGAYHGPSSMSGGDILSVNAGLSIKMFEATYGTAINAARMSRAFVYSMRGMVCLIVLLGTVGSLWMYGRVMPPLPDLVAGYGGASGKGGSHVSCCVFWFLSVTLSFQ